MTVPVAVSGDRGALAWPVRRAVDQPPAASWPLPWRHPPASPPLARPPEATLRFDEAELARLAAAAASRAAGAARASAAAALESGRAAAVARLADSLAEATRQGAERRSIQRAALAGLVGAVLRAVAAERTRLGAAGLPDVVARMLVEPPPGVAATLRVDPAAAEALHDLLPELAQAAGLTGQLDLVPDPELAPGGARLVWSEGWVEHAPDRIERLLDQALAALPAPVDPDRNPSATREGDV